MEINRPEFEEIRAFYDSDVPSKLWPLADEPAIEPFVKAAMPDLDMNLFRKQIKSMTTIKEFQTNVVAKMVIDLGAKCTDSLELKGIENLKPGHSSVFITNHRDIVLDSAFLNSLLNRNGKETAEIAIGDNLFAFPWIKDLVRLNRSFVVKRNVPVRQMLEVSKLLSSYIHHTITEKKVSIWIAQREGRSKDCSDMTQSSVIKMLALGGGTRDIIQNIRQLNLQPVALSYEYDPCDFLKAQEFQLKRDDPQWKKSKEDDVKSMVIGMRGYKGKVIFRICPELNDIFDTYPWIDDRNAQVTCVCDTVDNVLHANMQLFPINYIAYNLRFDTDKYADRYSKEDEAKVLAYLNGQLAKIQIPNKDESFLWNCLLTMYSNPVINYENVKW